MANIFSNLFNFNKRSSQALVDKQNDWIRSVSNNYVKDISTSDAHLISTVYTCINVLSSTISRLPIEIYKTDGIKKALLKEHRLYKLLKFNPQSFYNDQQWKSQQISNLYFSGNAYAVNTGSELQILHPDLISDIKLITNEKNGKNDLWYYSKSLSEVFRFNDVIHFKTLPKFGQSFFGLNPIDSLKSEINIQYKSEKFVENFLSKNGNTTKVLESTADGKQAGNKNIQELVKEFTERVGIGGTEGLYVVPPLFTLKELSINPESIQFLQSNKFTTQQIAALFQVPDHLAGIGGTSGYGRYEEQSLSFKAAIAGTIAMMEAELNFKLLSVEERLEGISIEFDTRPLTSIDMLTHVNAMKMLKDAGALSPNELRSEFNLSYVDNEQMNGYYQQMQYVNLLNKASGNTNSNSVNYLVGS